jgi:hypothetical protein
MANQPTTDVLTLDPAVLGGVLGGAGRLQPLLEAGGKAIEWGRKTFNAAAVALNIMHPTQAPIKTIPEPKRIERVMPSRQTPPGAGPRGGE